MLLVSASTPVAGAVERERRERAVGVGDPEPRAEAVREVGRVGAPGRRPGRSNASSSSAPARAASWT